MARVRCRACREYVIKEEAIYVGLGFVCDGDCLSKARNRPPATPRKPKAGIPPDIRKKVRERDGNACRYCRSTRNLQVHHIRYRSEGGPDVEENLITLCDVHHALMHSSKQRWQPVLLAMMDELYQGGRFHLVLQYEALLNARADGF